MATRVTGLRRRVFLKGLIKYLCLILVPLLLSSLLLVLAMTVRTGNMLLEQSASCASLYRMNFDHIFSAANQVRIYIDSTPGSELSLMQLLREEHPSHSALEGFRNLGDFITAGKSANTFMYSCYITKGGSPYVIVDGDRILLEEFSDRGFIEDQGELERTRVVSRRIEQKGLDGIPVVSIYQKTRYGDIVVCNIQKSDFTSILKSSGHDPVLVDRSGNVVVGSPVFEAEVSSFLASLISSGKSYGLFEHTLYVLGALDTVDLYYVDVIPESLVFNSLHSLLFVLGLILFVGVAASFILSYIVSQVEYRKIGRIIRVFDEEAGDSEDRIFQYTHGDVYIKSSR